MTASPARMTLAVRSPSTPWRASSALPAARLPRGDAWSAMAGRDPVITAENERWLHRLGALMLDRLGLGGREAAEGSDD